MEYGQFCPIAKAAEVLGEKWTILILRELLYGSSRFNDFQNAISGISPTMLSKRLRELELKGVVVKEDHDYRLTQCGEELAPLIRQYAIWGMRWARGDMADDELDAQLLMYDMRRRIKTQFMPHGGALIHVQFRDQPQDTADWWLNVTQAGVELLEQAPDKVDDLLLESDLRSLTQLWLGDITLRQALARQLLRLKGMPLLIRGIEDWLPLARQAAVRPARPVEAIVRPQPSAPAVPASKVFASEPTVSADAESAGKAKSKPKAKSKTQPKAKSKAKAKAGAKAKAKTKTKAPVRAKAKTKAKSKSKARARTKAKS